MTADDVDELGVDRAAQRRDDVGGLAVERVARLVLRRARDDPDRRRPSAWLGTTLRLSKGRRVEPLVFGGVPERRVGVEEVLGGKPVARPRDVLRIEVE